MFRFLFANLYMAFEKGKLIGLLVELHPFIQGKDFFALIKASGILAHAFISSI